MRIYWQILFLVSFLICSGFFIASTMSAYSRGEELAESNLAYVGQSGFKSLEDYCAALGIEAPSDKIQSIAKDVFNPPDNPLICAADAEGAKKAYGLYVQTEARRKSTRFTFYFIGVWMGLLLCGALFQRIWSKKKPAAEA